MTKHHGPRDRNFTIRLSGTELNAFYDMAEELDARPPSALAREILLEFMQCHYGAAKSKQRGILSTMAEVVPVPMRLQYAVKR